MVDRRPFLILGADLADFLKTKRRRTKLEIAEFYCFKCRRARAAALGAVEYNPMSPSTGNLRALCECCTTLMHKAFSEARLPELAKVLTVTILERDQHLVDDDSTSQIDHLKMER